MAKSLLILLLTLLASVCAAQPMSPPPYAVSSEAATYPSMPGASTVSLGDDDLSGVISPGGFSFNMFGVSHTSFRIGSNGYILLGSAGTTTSTSPAHATDGPAISPFWHDLVPSAGGTVSWLLVSNTVLFVEWRNVPVRVGSDTTTYGVTVAIEVNCANLSIACYFATPSAGGFTALPTASAHAVAISKAPGAGTYQTMNGFDAGFVAADGSVTTYPAGRMIKFWRNPPPINPLEITTANTLPVGDDGQAYTAPLNANGGIMPYGGWIGGGLPQGWVINLVGGANQGQLAAANGGDVHGGVYQLWIEVYCAGYGHDLESFRLPINPPNGVEGQSYSYQMNASGGFTPHVWSANNLPSWLSLNQTGLLTASTLPVAGVYTLDVSVQDSGPNPWVYQGQLELVVDPGALAITTQSPLPAGTEYTPYNLTLQCAGGTAPYIWGATGLPSGWQMSATGQLSAAGTMVNVGTYNFDVSVTDSDPAGPTTAVLPCTITVNPLPPVVIQITALPDATLGYAYSATISASGGSGSGYTWAVVAGSLPPGLSLATSGTPTVALGGQPTTAGLYTFEVKVTDDLGNVDSDMFTINASAPSLGSGSAGEDSSAGCTAASSSAAGWWWLVWLVAGAIGAGRRARSRVHG
jgi:hypothetical protein